MATSVTPRKSALQFPGDSRIREGNDFEAGEERRTSGGRSRQGIRRFVRHRLQVALERGLNHGEDRHGVFEGNPQAPAGERGFGPHSRSPLGRGRGVEKKRRGGTTSRKAP